MNDAVFSQSQKSWHPQWPTFSIVTSGYCQFREILREILKLPDFHLKKTQMSRGNKSLKLCDKITFGVVSGFKNPWRPKYGWISFIFCLDQRQKGCRKVILCLVNSCQLSMKNVHICGWCCHVLSCYNSNQNGDKVWSFTEFQEFRWLFEEWRWTQLCVTFNMIPGLESLQSSDQISDFSWK